MTTTGAGPLGSTVLIETIPGKTATPISVGVYSPNPNVPPNPLAIFSVTTNITIIAASAGATGTVTLGPLPLTTFPTTVQPPPGTRFVITPSVYLAADLATPLVGLPYVALTFGGGSPLTKLGAGPANWTLLPSSSYMNLALGATFRLYYATALASNLSVPVSVQAVMCAVAP